MCDTKKVNINKTLIQKKTLDENEEIYNFKNHLNYIIKFFMNQEFNEKKIIEKNIKQKLSSYRTQDINKKRWVQESFITFDQCIEKILESKLNCYYCKKKMLLCYKNIREPLQWTLDRYNNNIGHYSTNVCVCCLQCNLQRRVKNSDHFKFTKQLIIHKSE